VPLHLTRIAYGCSSLAELEAAIERRAVDGRILLTTRNRPRRAEELVGGSLYWIVRHQLVARSAILAFADADDGRTNILLEAKLTLVAPVPKRAHQGWRYLADGDAPGDLDAHGGEPMPPELAASLAEAGLF
jgi:hypothetical protein